MSERER
jgi:hypothetical protein